MDNAVSASKANGRIFTGPGKTAVRRRIWFAIIGCVLGLAIPVRLARGVDADSFIKKLPPIVPEGERTYIPLPRFTNEFQFSVPSLGPGLYDGQYRINSLGEKKPDGSGVLLLTQGNRRQERFSGWWNMGTPENGEYRFANGWKWYGNFSDMTAAGPLHTGGSWLTGLTFENAESRAREAQPPSRPDLPQPATNTGDATSSVDVVVITDPGQVTVRFDSTNQHQQQTSDAEGNLQLRLPAGSYHLMCAKPGYQRKERDFSVRMIEGQLAFCRVKLDPEYSASPVDRSEDARHVVGEENFPFMLAEISADDFASCVQVRARAIQEFLQGEAGVAKQPAVVQVISGFWRKVAQGVLDGYRLNCKKARLAGQLDGNRRFLEVALGAAAADYATTRSEPASWGPDYYFPFPKSDGIEPDDHVLSSYRVTNYIWQTFPKDLLEQNVAARILPRLLKIPLKESSINPTSAKDPPPLLMALVPNPIGSVRLPHGTEPGKVPSKDRRWRPEAPFYMAATETSFGQMRIFAHWVEEQLSLHPEQAKWFTPIPATKQLVGAENLPYTGVTLDEALSFCNWLSFCHGREPVYARTKDGPWTQDRTKCAFRLPDETEWEYAARFGFDFCATSGTPRWTELQDQFAKVEVGGRPDHRLVYFSTASQSGASPRAVDDPAAWLYPLALRDLCGNAGEVCLDETSTADILRWVVRGGQYTSIWEGAVMPWGWSEFKENANAESGFRVILPVPMDNFLNE